MRAAARAALDAGETHYIPNNGAPELLRALSAYEKRVNGLDYAPEEIIVTAGATEALREGLDRMERFIARLRAEQGA